MEPELVTIDINIFICHNSQSQHSQAIQAGLQLLMACYKLSICLQTSLSKSSVHLSIYPSNSSILGFAAHL